MDKEDKQIRLEKCKILKDKGYTYDSKTGKIFGVRGKEITNINQTSKYIYISGSTHFKGNLLGHHFAWYWVYGNVDFEMLDHINRNKTDNRISNLRISTNQKNQFNSNAKGYTWNKRKEKWQSHIKLNQKYIYLGLFNSEDDARNAYLKAKEIYHII